VTSTAVEIDSIDPLTVVITYRFRTNLVRWE
jgi:hypothetical protein